MLTQNILLVACYESGHQPLSLAWPAAYLQRAHIPHILSDLSLETPSSETVRAATFIGLAAPMHTALRLAADFARHARALNPTAHICFFGLYAWLNADYLLAHLADSVIGGEYEQSLFDLIESLGDGRDPSTVPGVSTVARPSLPNLARADLPIPQRDALPAHDHYARYLLNDETYLAGYIEATRGCLHTCTHCPIVPIYNGRFFAVSLTTVLADIRQQVNAGVAHITFGDPDFLNGPTHALRLAHALHTEFPYVTFDFTTKVEHILKHAALFPEFAALGCAFITSAIESLSDRVLAHLHKGHTATDVHTALTILDSANIALHPTFVAFTPWTTLSDYLALTDFIQQYGLEEHVAPVQLSIRLLIPPHSLILAAPDAPAWLGDLDAPAFTYRWTHPDARLDALHATVAALVAEAEQDGEDAITIHAAIRALAYAQAGCPPPIIKSAYRPRPPRLTENWFC